MFDRVRDKARREQLLRVGCLLDLAENKLIKSECRREYGSNSEAFSSKHRGHV